MIFSCSFPFYTLYHSKDEAKEECNNKTNNKTAEEEEEKKMPSKEHQPSASLVSPNKKRSPTPSPKKPTGGPKVQALMNVCEATMMHGNIATYDVKKADGSPSYKAALTSHVMGTGAKLAKDASILTYTNHKVQPTEDSDRVNVGSNNDIPDKILVGYVSDEADAAKNTVKLAKGYSQVTTNMRDKTRKLQCKPGNVVNPKNPVHADQILFNGDIANIITQLWDREVYNDISEDILPMYFSMTPLDVAAELVEKAYDNAL